MGLFDVFLKKTVEQKNSDIADFVTPPCCSSEWFRIGEYYYRIQISQKHINIKLRWEDYGTGGRLGWCVKENTEMVPRYMFVIKEIFCNHIIDSLVSLQPYKTITDEQIKTQKLKLYSYFDEEIKSVFTQTIADEERMVVLEIYDIVTAFNNCFPQKSIDFNNIFIGECVNKPGCIGCFYRGNGWYLYHVDDRFNLLQNGPFSLNGIIVALSHMLYIPKEFQSREFDEEEYHLYLNGEKAQ